MAFSSLADGTPAASPGLPIVRILSVDRVARAKHSPSFSQNSVSAEANGFPWADRGGGLVRFQRDAGHSFAYHRGRTISLSWKTPSGTIWPQVRGLWAESFDEETSCWSRSSTRSKKRTGALATVRLSLRASFLRTSSRTLQVLGLPFLHYTRGRCPETGKRLLAVGFIAIGRKAFGVVAIGQASMGVIAIGEPRDRLGVRVRTGHDGRDRDRKAWRSDWFSARPVRHGRRRDRSVRLRPLGAGADRHGRGRLGHARDHSRQPQKAFFKRLPWLVIS